jgi:hypothetical protein
MLYWGANTYYKMELHELAPGSQVVNNTIIGSAAGATGYNFLWYALLNYDPYYYTGDANDFVIANNLFVGNVGGIPAGCTYTNNIAFGMDGTTQAQLDVSHPGNEVWCSSPSVATDVNEFMVSGNTFVGSADMNDYGFDLPADANDGFAVAGAPVGLGDCFAPVMDANAVDAGDPTYATSSDIRGYAANGVRDIGAYEYVIAAIASSGGRHYGFKAAGKDLKDGGKQ